MPLYFEVDETTLVYSIDAVPLASSSSMDRAGLLKAVIEKSGRIREHYDATLTKHGKILGQGRIGLIELIDDIFIDAILLFENFRKSLRSEDAPFAGKIGIDAKSENRMNKLSLSGSISARDVSLKNDFGRTYDELVVKNLKQMLIIYKAMTNDSSVINPVFDLLSILDSILYSLVIIRYNVHKCTIDR